MKVSKFFLHFLPFALFKTSHGVQNSSNSRDQFDFIIAGGGTAGAVLANRLSEEKSFQVLLIEAGPSNEGVLNSQVPFFWARLQNSLYDWNFTTTPQSGLNGRSLAYPRGHILGGSSSINAMFYTRGSSDDYDRWASVTGDIGWSWNNMLPYFKKHERWTEPVEPRNTTGQFDPSVHGFKGKTSTGFPGHLQSIDNLVVRAAEELGGEFQFRLDMNSGNPLGTCWWQGTVGHGERSSSATSYLTKDVLERPNLHILLNTRVTRILKSKSTSSSTPVLTNVEIHGNGITRVITATKEVVLSAGAIGSPHILLHSGIGDREELQRIGIKSVVDLPSVGKNLTDHPLFGMGFRANVSDTSDEINRDPVLFNEAFQEWQTSRTGPMTMGVASNHIIWLRLPTDSPIFERVVDPSAGVHTPHWELAISNGGSPDSRPAIGSGIAIVSPASRGFLAINSTNPLDPPIIDPALMTAEIDRVFARESIRSVRRFYSAQTWNGIVFEELPNTANLITDEEIDDHIRGVASTAWHPVSTAVMSARGASYGVVDPDLKLKKAEGLRIVDASVMPYIIAGHTQTPVYVIAERAADLIKAEWSQ